MPRATGPDEKNPPRVSGSRPLDSVDKVKVFPASAKLFGKGKASRARPVRPRPKLAASLRTDGPGTYHLACYSCGNAWFHYCTLSHPQFCSWRNDNGG